MNKRPSSIAEVAAWSVSDETFNYNLADFLDQFRRLRDHAMLAEEPPTLVDRIELGLVGDAYLAAVAVSLAREIAGMPPSWSLHENRKLQRPWFAHPGPRLRATLLAESPGPFRERNLFVSRNALSRA